MGELIPIQVKPVLIHSTPTTSRAAEGQEHQKGTGRSCVHPGGRPVCIMHTCLHHGPRVTQSASYNAGHTAGGRPREGSEAAVLTRSCVSAAHTRAARLSSSHCALERITPTTGEANCAEFTMGGGEETTQGPARPTHPKSLPKPDAEEAGELSAVWASGPPPTLTSAVLLVRPVPAVVLPVAFPPVGDAVPVLTLELEVAGAGGGLGGVFWGMNRRVSCMACTA